jgi:HEPN domain-containing protein
MAADAAASWLKVVDEDLRQVVNNLRGSLPSPAGAAYHCQQAAEKLVKAGRPGTSRLGFSENA